MSGEHPEVSVVSPGSFEPENHYYPRTLNAQTHPLVRFLMGLGNERLAERYCHLHPEVNRDAVFGALAHVPHYFRWGGTDLIHATTESGVRQIVVIETNSSPSGQKSFPFSHASSEQAGYRALVERTLLPTAARRPLPQGRLAVLYDKNPMEVSGYAATLADAAGEDVLLVPWFDEDPDPPAAFDEQRVLYVRLPDGTREPVRAALRYVTQRPWNRIPPLTRTLILNPVVVDLAGGRNKMLAAKAYDVLNADLREHGLVLRTPDTIWDLPKDEIPLWVRRMGGVAVVKVPYSNAGQGVFTITSQAELDAFMARDFVYDRFIVQALIGNVGWSSRSRSGRLYHVGTVPDRHGRIFVADLRFMVGASPEGFYPIAIYARRSREPLRATLTPDVDSWAMLGTNLSVRQPDGSWHQESERLVLMDNRDFNPLGLGLDDLVEGYIQTVLAMTAIDEMARRLVTQRGAFRRRFFQSLNPDEALGAEIFV